jgi:hypothetical protein
MSFWVIVGLILLNKLGCFDELKKELMIYDEFKFINKTWKRCKNISQKIQQNYFNELRFPDLNTWYILS